MGVCSCLFSSISGGIQIGVCLILWHPIILLVDSCTYDDPYPYRYRWQMTEQMTDGRLTFSGFK